MVQRIVRGKWTLFSRPFLILLMLIFKQYLSLHLHFWCLEILLVPFLGGCIFFFSSVNVFAEQLTGVCFFVWPSSLSCISPILSMCEVISAQIFVRKSLCIRHNMTLSLFYQEHITASVFSICAKTHSPTESLSLHARPVGICRGLDMAIPRK